MRDTTRPVPAAYWCADPEWVLSAHCTEDNTLMPCGQRPKRMERRCPRRTFACAKRAVVRVLCTSLWRRRASFDVELKRQEEAVHLVVAHATEQERPPGLARALRYSVSKP